MFIYRDIVTAHQRAAIRFDIFICHEPIKTDKHKQQKWLTIEKSMRYISLILKQFNYLFDY
jgi:hypothetical protein